MKHLVLFTPAIFLSACSSAPGPVVPKTKVEKQMIGLMEKFDRWDDDGDGYLTANEIQDGIDSLKGKPQEVSYKSAAVLEFYDTNKDGRISLREAQAGYKRAAEAESKLGNS
jgi:Ca2+-binding EF-hand superfamily protein